MFGEIALARTLAVNEYVYHAGRLWRVILANGAGNPIRVQRMKNNGKNELDVPARWQDFDGNQQVRRVFPGF